MEALCLDILNSDWQGYLGGEPARDRLLDAGWLENLLHRRELQAVAPPGAEARAALQTLRSAMRGIVEANNSVSAPSEQDIATINAALALMPAVPHLSGEKGQYFLACQPLQADWRWLVREVAFSFAHLLSQHDPLRLKRCQNPACGWFFYDESRQRNRQWCNQTCADLMRVRRYRARHHASTAEVQRAEVERTNPVAQEGEAERA